MFVNHNDLFFDSFGAGQFEMCEYVDRRFVTSTNKDPMDLVIGADVKNGIFDDYDFTRFLYRGESAIYQSIQTIQGEHLGAEDDNVLLSNVFGSPVLSDPTYGWPAHDYTCLSTIDPSTYVPFSTVCNDNVLPPLNDDGTLQLNDDGFPILLGYPGALAPEKVTPTNLTPAAVGSPFALGYTNITVDQTFPNIQSALVSVPLFTNPYDPTSPPLTPLQMLIPWLPKQPGVGFPIAVNGAQDKFVETAQLDFSGTTISANIDYDDQNPAKPTGALALLAVETTDFLGDVFLCLDPNTNNIMHARMYTPVEVLLDWIAQHQDAANQCGMIIRYSPFNNYVDYITSLSAGVRLSVTQGGGFGRIVDVTLFVPGQWTS